MINLAQSDFLIKVNGKRKLSFSLEQYIRAFQAEVYVIKACAVENLERNYKNRNIYILSVKQQLKHLVNTKSPQNWTGTATVPHTTGQT
jgi:hypothetical protein